MNLIRLIPNRLRRRILLAKITCQLRSARHFHFVKTGICDLLKTLISSWNLPERSTQFLIALKATPSIDLSRSSERIPEASLNQTNRQITNLPKLFLIGVIWCCFLGILSKPISRLDWVETRSLRSTVLNAKPVRLPGQSRCLIRRTMPNRSWPMENLLQFLYQFDFRLWSWSLELFAMNNTAVSKTYRIKN